MLRWWEILIDVKMILILIYWFCLEFFGSFWCMYDDLFLFILYNLSFFIFGWFIFVFVGCESGYDEMLLLNFVCYEIYLYRRMFFYKIVFNLFYGDVDDDLVDDLEV